MRNGSISFEPEGVVELDSWGWGEFAVKVGREAGKGFVYKVGVDLCRFGATVGRGWR